LAFEDLLEVGRHPGGSLDLLVPVPGPRRPSTIPIHVHWISGAFTYSGIPGQAVLRPEVAEFQQNSTFFLFQKFFFLDFIIVFS
jgi:hypothetical protein